MNQKGKGEVYQIKEARRALLIGGGQGPLLGGSNSSWGVLFVNFSNRWFLIRK